MQFPIQEKFELSKTFLDGYKETPPKWGFNGLGEFVYLRTYSRILPDGRNEAWWETIKRVVEGIYSIQKQHIKDYNLGWNQAKAQKSAQEMYDRMFNFKILPSGRSMWSMGTDLIMKRGLTEALYSCSYLTSKNIAENPGLIFGNIMDFLMLGIGVGFDVQGAGKVEVKPQKEIVHTYQIPDSREGWVESLTLLINSYFGGNNYNFDYSLVRPAGSPIKTFGGISAGPEPLIKLHESVVSVLTNNIGSQITVRTIADIANMIGRAVVAGNVRRCIPKGTLIHTTEGLKPVENLSLSDKVYTSKGEHNVKNVFVQGTQQTITLNTQIGTLECTPNHKVAVLTNPYEYIWKKAEHVTCDDYLVFLENVIEGKETDLPSFEYIKVAHSTTCKDIKVPKLDNGISWLIGNFHGDGYVYPNFIENGFNAHISLAMSPDYPEMIDFAESKLDSFGIKTYRQKGTELDRSIKIRCQSKQLAWYFSNFKTAKENMVIPDFIKQGGVEIRSSYLAGLFDADGSCRTRPLLAVATVYYEFAKEIQSLYASLGIPTRIKTKLRDNNWKTLYDINIVGEQSIENFSKLIGKFSFKYKDNRKTKYSRHSFTFSKKFLNLYGIKTQNGMTFETFNRKYPKTNFVPVQVNSKKYNTEPVETYDVEVEDVHEYICNQGFLVHNSAIILLGNNEDEFLDLKNYEKNPDRMEYGWASNNTVYAELGMSYKNIADEIVKRGEPGVYFKENAQAYGRIRATEKDWKDRRVEGLNPCIVGDTLVAVADGRKSVTIKQLAEEGEDVYVYSIGENNKLNINLMVNPRITGYNQPVYKVNLDNNRFVRVTENHKFIMTDGTRVEANQLKFKDSIKTLYRVLEPKPFEKHDELVGKESTCNIRVVSVEFDGYEDVYNGTVENDHNFAIGGFIEKTHKFQNEKEVYIFQCNCGEITLEPSELCNLCDMVPDKHIDLDDFKKTIKYAYLYSKTITLLNTNWPETNKVMLRNRRIGLSLTGVTQFVANRGMQELKKWMREGYSTAQYYDEVYSDWLAIPKSKKLTTAKPSGSVSLLAGATPGIHYPESNYYIRRVRLASNSPFLTSLKNSGYKVEPSNEDPEGTFIVEFPVSIGENTKTLNDVSMWEQLNLASFVQENWADNSVSVTVTFKKEEEKSIESALDFYQFKLKAVSFLPK